MIQSKYAIRLPLARARRALSGSKDWHAECCADEGGQGPIGACAQDAVTGARRQFGEPLPVGGLLLEFCNPDTSLERLDILTRRSSGRSNQIRLDKRGQLLRRASSSSARS